MFPDTCIKYGNNLFVGFKNLNFALMETDIAVILSRGLLGFDAV